MKIYYNLTAFILPCKRIYTLSYHGDFFSLKNMKKALWQLHVSVFLAGFTGVLGKLIHLNEAPLVWYRILITIVTLFLVLFFQKKLVRVPFKKLMQLTGIGALIAVHWVCFYASIRLSNVSVGLVCFASVGLFTSILEPVVTTKKFSWPEFGLGLLSLLGIYLIFHFDFQYQLGITIGIVSAFLAALFSALNKKQVAAADTQTVMLYELSGGWLVLSIGMPLYLHFFPGISFRPNYPDWGWLFVLSWLCTLLGMNLMLKALQKVSAFTQNLTLNLEPVYGILLAFAIFGENRELGLAFYAGVGLIFLSVLLQMVRMSR